MNKIKLFFLVTAIIFIFSFTGTAESQINNSGEDFSSQIDPRSYQHGITILQEKDSSDYVIWSSSGNPPKGELPDGNWTHDIFYSILNPKNPIIKPVKLISRPEAQEPSSAAQTNDGHIMITMEDGWNVENEVSQRYAVFDKNLKPILPYPQMILDGGHSGHVAAIGNRFVVFYSNDWIDGGGFNDLGSGKDVLASIFDSNGKLIKGIDVAVDTDRNCWPVIAGSETDACLVWQHFIGDQMSADLMFSILDPISGKLVKDSVRLHTNIRFYHYSVAYIPTIKRFIIMGTDNKGNGFGYLIDNKGNITASNQSLPPVMRESQLVVGKYQGKAVFGMVTTPDGAAVLSVTGSEIKVLQVFKDDYEWQYCGTDGIFINEKVLLMVSLSTSGIVERKYALR